jgi:UDP-N-acetylmuramate--alanine ligase
VRACGHRDVSFVPERAALAQAMHGRVRTGDLVLTLGAGDVTHVGEELLALLGGGGRA